LCAGRRTKGYLIIAYKKCEGVSGVTVDFAKSTATVAYDPKTANEKTLLTRVLKGTRFAASRIEERDKEKDRKEN